jgi:hypothetical protein
MATNKSGEIVAKFTEGIMNIRIFGASAIAILAATPALGVTTGPLFTYVTGSLTESKVTNGPWTLHQAGSHDASGIKVPSVAGTPYAGYCNAQGKVTTNQGSTSVMQPYYFPFVFRTGTILQGFFDYRPRNEQEATVAAISRDWGATWIVTSQALGLNKYCPFNIGDPDNNYVYVNALQTTYGAFSKNAADNGLGHAFIMTVGGVQRIYNLNRADGHIDSDQLVVHTIPLAAGGTFLTTLPALGYQSPFAPNNVAPPTTPVTGNYPTLDTTAQSTTGLLSSDAILGAVNFGGSPNVIAVIYVSKILNGTKLKNGKYPITQPPYNQPPYNLNYPTPVGNCAATPDFALTNIVNQSPKSANTDVTAVRVATTTDGVNFTDIGAVPFAPNPGALTDPNSVGAAGVADSFSGIRWLGSGSIVPLTNGKYGLFFGAGNCLDNDSDGFHFIGYAETTNAVSGPSDLLSWKVINGLDNPIMSTDTVTDTQTPYSQYPAQTPIVNLTGVNLLTPSQVLPWTPPTPAAPIVTPPGGYTSNFYSGRLYDPQVIYKDNQTLTIVFAGYNTPQPSNNLGDYRSIGRFQLTVPTNYFKPF